MIPFKEYDYNSVPIDVVKNTLRLPDDKYYGVNFLHINNPNPHEHIIWLGNPKNKLHTQLQVQTDAIRTISEFRRYWELLVERLIDLENLSMPISSSFSISAQLYNMINSLPHWMRK